MVTALTGCSAALTSMAFGRCMMIYFSLAAQSMLYISIYARLCILIQRVLELQQRLVRTITAAPCSSCWTTRREVLRAADMLNPEDNIISMQQFMLIVIWEVFASKARRRRRSLRAVVGGKR
jgi:hypothetical protein